VKLNCLIVAAGLWLRARGRAWFCVRRSVSLAGLVPHCGYIEDQGRHLTLIEYIPRKRKGSGPGADTALLFHGRFRVRRFVEVSRVEADTLQEAVRGDT